MNLVAISFILLSPLMHLLGVSGDISHSAPDCVLKCWDNSQFVSACMNQMKCLCEEAGFQNAVFQCLYSQCQTTEFGAALHHALSQCLKYGFDASPTAPPLIRHGHLYKRQVDTPNHASGSISASAIHSVHHRYASVTTPADSLSTQDIPKDSGHIYVVGKHRVIYSSVATRAIQSDVLSTTTTMANP